MSIHLEARYFFVVIPAVCALAATIVGTPGTSRLRSIIGPAVICLGVGVNIFHARSMPAGLVGHEAVAARIAALEEPGNVLLCCWHDCELIFRARCRELKHQRQFLRGDRVLAVRVPTYGGVNSRSLVEDPKDLPEVMRLGRIRYLVTSPARGSDVDRRPDDMVLAHDVFLDEVPCLWFRVAYIYVASPYPGIFGFVKLDNWQGLWIVDHNAVMV